MKPVRILGPAEIEFEEATRWYRDRDPRVADRFAEQVANALELIEKFPNIGSRVPEIEDRAVRRMPVHGFPYHVVFAHMGDRLDVVAIAHNRRGPRYFRRLFPSGRKR